MIGGRYSLDREIGRGGMGSVWLGRDEVLGRLVAIKRIGPMIGGSSPDLVRAEREARIAARVNHPHVVAVFDLVHEGDQKWLVMEYVGGMTLAEHIRARGRLGLAEAAPLLAQAAEALSAAHEAGVVHRDVKPSNILVTPDGVVKLSDFGIARAEADASLTATGLVTGSPAYIAPEVASGRLATGASDVWSLGATAYHAVSGRPPYDVGDNVLGALYRIVHEEPPRLEDGGWLEPFVAAAMTRDPALRWSMGEVSSFLRAGGADPGPPPRTPTFTDIDPSIQPDDPSTQVLSVPTYQQSPEEARVGPPPDAGVIGKRRPRVLAIVIGVCALVLAVLVAALLLNDGSKDAPVGEPSGSATSERTQTATAPIEEAMTSFVETYLETADSDPASAFGLLTPGYQSESGGLAGYEGFWGDVTNVRVGSLEANPRNLTVTYTYSYNYRGDGSREDTVLMQLEANENSYLIAGARTVG